MVDLMGKVKGKRDFKNDCTFWVVLITYTSVFKGFVCCFICWEVN